MIMLLCRPAGLNMAVFLLIGKTSALTMNIGGVVKDWLLIGLSVWLYKWVHWRGSRWVAVVHACCLQSSGVDVGFATAQDATPTRRSPVLYAVHRRSAVSQLNLFGYSIAFAAVCWYNYQKLQAVSSC